MAIKFFGNKIFMWIFLLDHFSDKKFFWEFRITVKSIMKALNHLWTVDRQLFWKFEAARKPSNFLIFFQIWSNPKTDSKTPNLARSTVCGLAAKNPFPCKNIFQNQSKNLWISKIGSKSFSGPLPTCRSKFQKLRTFSASKKLKRTSPKNKTRVQSN